MKKHRTLHVALTIIGICALAAYLIACRPSWSPDGTKVLFHYVNRGKNKVGIAMYDRSSGKTESIFGGAASVGWKNDPAGWPWAQWDRAGTRAIVVWAEGEGTFEHLQIRILPLDSDEKAQQVRLPDVHPVLGVPLCQVSHFLFVGGRVLARVDLRTGKVDRRELEGEGYVVLVGHQDDIYYCCSRPGSPDVYEFGQLDHKRLELKSKLRLPADEAGSVSPLMAIAPDGSTIAATAKKRDRLGLLLIAGERVKRRIPIQLAPNTSSEVGNLQWSPDGKTIYAALVLDAKDEDRIQLALGEVTLATGKLRVVPLVQVKREDPGIVELMPLLFQIAVSPDGKTIATAPTYLVNQPIDDKDRALYLVDLTGPERKVTQIPAIQIPEAPDK